MTKFADQLFDDLIREHGSTLTNARPPPRRQVATRRALLAVGGGGVAVAAAAGVLVATAGTNAAGHSGQAVVGKALAYSVTNNPNGTVTLAVYQKSGIAGANAKLRELGDSRVYVVPAGPGCPSMSSLSAPAVPLKGRHLSVQSSTAADGSVTVNAQGIPVGDLRDPNAEAATRAVTVDVHGIPVGDILAVAVEPTANDGTTTTLAAVRLTSLPAPSCVSLPAPPTHP